MSSFTQSVRIYWSDQNALIHQNEKLQEEVATLSMQTMRIGQLALSNQQLNALLGLKDAAEGELMFSQIIGYHVAGPIHEFFLDKGKADGVGEGTAVFDNNGLLGQVIESQEQLSRVMLTTDYRHALPVMSVNNERSFIAHGTGEEGLLLINTKLLQHQLGVGEKIVTSGLGGRFPRGYPVGEVVDIQESPTNDAFDIYIKPYASLDKLYFVILYKQERFEEQFLDFKLEH